MAWTNLGQPPSAPTTSAGGIGDDGGIWTAADGKIVVQTGDDPGFDGGYPSGFSTKTYNADLSSNSGLRFDANGDNATAYTNSGMACDAAGNYYYLTRDFTASPAIVWLLMKGNGASASPTGFSYTPSDFPSISGVIAPRCMASNQAGTILYAGSDATSGTETVWKIDLVTGAVTTFKTSAHTAAGFGFGQGCILVLPDDSVIVAWGGRLADQYPKRYAADGTLLNTYSSLPNWTAVSAAIGIAYAYTGTTGPASIDSNSFFLGYYSSAPGYGTSIVKVNVATGVIVGHEFQTPSDGFEYDSIFTALNTPIGSTFPVNTLCISGYGDSGFYGFWYDFPDGPTPPTLPPSVLVNSNACCGATSGGPPSAGPVEPPINAAWIPSCTGGGLVPSAAGLALTEVWDY